MLLGYVVVYNYSHNIMQNIGRQALSNIRMVIIQSQALSLSISQIYDARYYKSLNDTFIKL